MKNTGDKRSREIDSILFKAETCYPNAEFDPSSFEVWHLALAEFEIEEISTAFSTHIKESKFLPTISEIIDIIKKNKGPQISIEARAQQQWRIVLAAVVTHGRANPPTFTDPITANLVKTQFRWPYLCDMRQENENYNDLNNVYIYGFSAPEGAMKVYSKLSISSKPGPSFSMSISLLYL